MTGRLIWIDGLIGAGKTSLADELGKKLNYRVLHEPVDSNPYLKPFYGDMHRWAYPMQIHLLAERFALQKLAAGEVLSSGRGVIIDRGLPGDRAFARLLTKSGHISELEWATYQRFYDIMCNDLRPPSALIFLDVDPRVAYERMKVRGRDCEAGVPLDYLQQLDRAYRDLLVDIESGRHAWSRGMRVIRWPWNEDWRAVSDLVEEVNRLPG